MNRDSYFFFFISLVFALGVTAAVGYFSFHYVYAISEKALIESRIEANRQEAVHMARLLAQKLKEGYTKQQVVEEFQKSIQYTPTDKGFECMFDQNGVQLCHPNPAKIGRKIDSTNSVVSLLNNSRFKENFENILQNGKPTGGVRKFLRKDFTEIIYVEPVEGSNLMVAVHANLAYIKKQLNDFREKLLYIFVISGLITTLIIFVFIRFLFLSMQHRMKKSKAKEVPVVPKMDPENPAALSGTESVSPDRPHRILANQGNKLVPLLLEDVAYAYIENKLTYLIRHNGEKLTGNMSLDDLMEQMDPHKFFRANRQFIVSIKSVDKVEKYGNSQLRVRVRPATDREIIISKLKMAAFKRWLGEQ